MAARAGNMAGASERLRIHRTGSISLIEPSSGDFVRLSSLLDGKRLGSSSTEPALPPSPPRRSLTQLVQAAGPVSEASLGDSGLSNDWGSALAVSSLHKANVRLREEIAQLRASGTPAAAVSAPPYQTGREAPRPAAARVAASPYAPNRAADSSAGVAAMGARLSETNALLLAARAECHRLSAELASVHGCSSPRPPFIKAPSVRCPPRGLRPPLAKRSV